METSTKASNEGYDEGGKKYDKDNQNKKEVDFSSYVINNRIQGLLKNPIIFDCLESRYKLNFNSLPIFYKNYCFVS